MSEPAETMITLEPQEQELLIGLLEIRLDTLKQHPTGWFDSLGDYEERRTVALIEKLKEKPDAGPA